MKSQILIEAAPDLLAALNEAREMLHSTKCYFETLGFSAAGKEGETFRAMTARVQATEERVHAAIAKAEGHT